MASNIIWILCKGNVTIGSDIDSILKYINDVDYAEFRSNGRDYW